MLVELGAVLTPVALWRPRGLVAVLVGVVFGPAGLAFLLFGALELTHIGLFINTSPAG